jgi:hypothetical protein
MTNATPQVGSRMPLTVFVGPLCLVPLLIIYFAAGGRRLPSFWVFAALELTVFVSWFGATYFSVHGIRKRSFKLKVLNYAVIVLAFVLAFLDGFGLL